VRRASHALGFLRAERAGRRQGRIALLFCGRSPNMMGGNTLLHLALVTAMVQRHLDVVWQSLDVGVAEVRVRAMGRVDGCLLLDHVPRTEDRWAVLLDELGRYPPTVAVNPGRELPLPAASPDDAGGARALLRDLAVRGHRRIAVAGHLRLGSQHGSQFRRHRALFASVPAGVELEDRCDRGPEELVRSLGRPGAPGAPSAMICLSGYTLPPLWCALVSSGWQLPRDLSLAACDDPPVLGDLRPTVTGVAWSMDLLVAAALRILDQALEGSPPAGEVLVPTRVVHRETTPMPGP
jgi:DNA-binding LacI/PurR family transcriptional regulator